MKIEVEENKPFVTVRISLDKSSKEGNKSVDTNFVINLLEERGIKVSNIKKSANIDNYSKGASLSGEWQFRNAAFPRDVEKKQPKPVAESVTESKTSTPKRRRRNASKPAVTGTTETN